MLWRNKCEDLLTHFALLKNLQFLSLRVRPENPFFVGSGCSIITPNKCFGQGRYKEAGHGCLKPSSPVPLSSLINKNVWNFETKVYSWTRLKKLIFIFDQKNIWYIWVNPKISLQLCRKLSNWSMRIWIFHKDLWSY